MPEISLRRSQSQPIPSAAFHNTSPGPFEQQEECHLVTFQGTEIPFTAVNNGCKQGPRGEEVINGPHSQRSAIDLPSTTRTQRRRRPRTGARRSGGADDKLRRAVAGCHALTANLNTPPAVPGSALDTHTSPQRRGCCVAPEKMTVEGINLHPSGWPKDPKRHIYQPRLHGGFFFFI